MTTTYTITLDLQGSVSHLNTLGQVVAVVKSPQAIARRASGRIVSPNPVIWLAIDPFDTITVTWEEHYYLYAADTFPDFGASISVSSKTPKEVNAGDRYIFKSGTFTGPGTGDPGWMEVQNEQQSPTPTPPPPPTPPDFCFGLTQQATLGKNGTSVMSPLNIMLTGYNETVAFQPKESVQVFAFTSCGNGTVLSFVASNALTLDLTPLNPSASAYFDSADNTFKVGIRPKSSPIKVR